jgi:hypothetical protein
MKPEDVPEELVEAASAKPEVGLVVWPHELRAILAVVLPMHDKQLQAERDALEANLASLQAFADRCREKDWAYAADKVATIERVRNLHPRDDRNPAGPWCPTCTVPWPCRTVQVLAAPESHEDAGPIEPVESFNGIFPDGWTGGLDSVEFVRQQRDRAGTAPETTSDAPTEETDHER